MSRRAVATRGTNGRSLRAIECAERASAGFDRIEDLEAALPAHDFPRLALPLEAAFLAGKCFLRYRRSGKEERSPLPDFFVGAHAAVAGMRLLTRDTERYSTYVPGLAIERPR